MLIDAHDVHQRFITAARGRRMVSWMRALGPAFVVSLALWSSIAWCVVALRVMAGHNHFHLSASDFGVYLLCIDLAFAVALAWYSGLKPRAN